MVTVLVVGLGAGVGAARPTVAALLLLLAGSVKVSSVQKRLSASNFSFPLRCRRPVGFGIGGGGRGGRGGTPFGKTEAQSGLLDRDMVLVLF